MKKILLICVNYNSYDALRSFLESVNRAAAKAQSECTVKVWIADNSSGKQPVSTASLAAIDCTYYPCENNGYIGTVEALMQNNNWTEAKAADFFIVSNVDICFSEDTFLQICAADAPQMGWIVPRIYSKCRDTEENPQALHRYSKQKLKLLHFIYKHPYIYGLYKQTVHFLLQKRRNSTSHTLHQQEIYAGNGSIFIFTKAFMEKNAPFHYPCFLYGEELFFAELVRVSHLKTVFIPDIYIENKTPNVSTKLLGYKNRSMYSAKAIEYILHTFY